MQIKRLTGTLGAEIIGADLRSEADWPQIRQAFIDHSVITIRDQKITPDDHLAFARRWGDINVNRFFTALNSHPEVSTCMWLRRHRGQKALQSVSGMCKRKK